MLMMLMANKRDEVAIRNFEPKLTNIPKGEEDEWFFHCCNVVKVKIKSFDVEFA